MTLGQVERFFDVFVLLKQELRILEKLSKLQNWPRNSAKGTALLRFNM
jgi:hypothetical protein